MTGHYTPTELTTPTRGRDRVRYDRATAHAILDEGYDCSVAFVVDGLPRIHPTLHVRVGETVYLHGSSGGRLGLSARGDALPVCVSVTLLDGLVYAKSHTQHSANYRSVVAHGTARLVTDDAEKRRALDALVDKVGEGRSRDSRAPDRKELAETSVLALPLTEVSVKVRAGGPNEKSQDLPLPYWSGVVPLRRAEGAPEAAPGTRADLPDYLAPTWSPWCVAPELRGRHVHLEQLGLSHVDELFAALGDDEVWQHLPTPRPDGPDAMRAIVVKALNAQWAGERVPWVQRDPASGELIGMTMYHDIDEAGRALGIGHTMLARRRWRSGVNTESKLLLLERAFDVLGAERVFWYTDIRNERSQRAIARLGASRDGLLRRHRLRPDGTWRDSVLFAMTADEWPSAAQRLRDRLAAGERPTAGEAAGGAAGSGNRAGVAG